MCGIFGVVKISPTDPIDLKSEIVQGLEKIKHRGPDGEGIWIHDSNQVGFGHVRLTIIDQKTGDQPMIFEDGSSLIFNGAIYNYLELREQLGVNQFSSNSDTEVIMMAYRKWGNDCVQYFRGMFSFLLWDNQKKLLFFARDRFGIKPLYYFETAKRDIYFASEIKAFLPFLEQRAINADALGDYFSFQFYLGEKTLLEGIKEIPPANYGVMKPNQSLTFCQYWNVEYNIDFEHPDKYFVDEVRNLAKDSISLHMRADVEVGAYVSGGVDSSLISILGNQLQQGKTPFKIFNGRFLESDAFDESQYAKAVADENDMDLHIATISESDFVDTISDVIYHLDTPVAGPGAFPQYMVSRLASEKMKVVLGGQGGDEIFGGYARYLIAYFEKCIQAAIEGTLNDGKFIVTYESIIPNLSVLQSYKPLIKEFWAEGVFDPIDQRFFRLINRSNTIKPILQSSVINKERIFEEYQSIFWSKNVKRESYFDLMTHFDFKTLLPALLQVEDRMSMAHGLESRVPFLDHHFVEFVATAPANVKFLNGELKRLLRTAFSHQLPEKVRNRKDKMGFPVPLNLWTKRKGPVRDFIGDVFSSQNARQRWYLADDFSLDSLLDSQGLYGRNLWALLSLELWSQQYIDE